MSSLLLLGDHARQVGTCCSSTCPMGSSCAGPAMWNRKAVWSAETVAKVCKSGDSARARTASASAKESVEWLHISSNKRQHSSTEGAQEGVPPAVQCYKRPDKHWRRLI